MTKDEEMKKKNHHNKKKVIKTWKDAYNHNN